MQEFTYAIPFRASCATRRANLDYTLKWISRFPNFELLLIEQDEYSRIDLATLPPGCRHLFIYNPGLFNKSWALNVAFRHSSGRVFAVGDADMLMHDHELMAALILCRDEYEVVNPFAQFLDIGPEETFRIQHGMTTLRTMFEKPTPRAGANFASGMILFQRRAYEKMGGWDERFFGWGIEDNVVAEVKVPVLIDRAIQLPYTGYHLWHERTFVDTSLQPHYERSYEIYRRYFYLGTDEIARLAAEDLRTMGDPHKFATDDAVFEVREGGFSSPGMNLPAVSVAIVVRDQSPEELDGTFQSILHQTLLPREIVVLDNGSLAEDTRTTLESFGHSFEQLNVYRFETAVTEAEASAYVLGLCSEAYIAQMEPGFAMAADRLQRQVEMMVNHPEINLLGGQVLQMGTQDLRQVHKSDYPPIADNSVLDEKEFWDLGSSTSIMIRRSALEDPVLPATPKTSLPGVAYWCRFVDHGIPLYNLEEIVTIQ
ncbi:MAG: glycosyltransferase [Bacteroidota bacterium]